MHTDTKKSQAIMDEVDEEDSDRHVVRSNLKPTIDFAVNLDQLLRENGDPRLTEEPDLRQVYGLDQPFQPNMINRRIEKPPKFKRGDINFSKYLPS